MIMVKKSWMKYTLLNQLRARIKRNRFCRKWNRLNPGNDTIPMNCFPPGVVSVGDYSYGELNVVTFDDKTHLKIGRFVSIAQNVTFLLDVEHHTNHFSTYPFRAKVLGEKQPEAFSKGDIVVADDVWIGYGAIICSGVHIGQGAVIAAGAVVTSDVPPYAIVGGVPAQVIKYRFEPDLVEELLKVDYSKLTEKEIIEKMDYLYCPITSADQVKRLENG